MVNFEKIQNDLEKIGSDCSADEFLFEFLVTFNFPKATINRIKIEYGDKVKEGCEIPVKNKFLYLYTSKANLFPELNLIKKRGAGRLKARFILVCNTDNVLCFDLQTEETLSSTKTDLYRSFQFFLPLLGLEKINHSPKKDVDVRAAEKFAELYNQLILTNEYKDAATRRSLNIFMARLLFLFFADSVEIIQKGKLYTIFSSFSDKSGKDLHDLIKNIFRSIANEERKTLPSYLRELPIIPIPLFENLIEIPNFNKRSRKLLLEISSLDWSSVNPDILGSLLQSIASPEYSLDLGPQFTSVPNIMKVLCPLFLDDFYEIFENEKTNYSGLLELLGRISQVKIFDPSCGSGCFLIIAYKELRLLESRIINQIKNSFNNNTNLKNRISLANFCGLDASHFACLVAEIGLCFTDYIVRKYSDYDQKQKVRSLSLEFPKIINGNPTRIDWRIAGDCKDEIYIIGNPPYKGSRKQSKEQKADVAYVFREYENTKNLDYAACWFYLACDFIKDSKGGAGLVCTNSVTQGEQVGLLWPKLFSKKVYISFAHTSFKWKNSGKRNTGVTVVVVGLRPDKINSKRVIYTKNSSYDVSSINPYLISAGNIIIKKRKVPISNLPHMNKGNMAYDEGYLILSSNEKNKLIQDYPGSIKFVKRLMGSNEFIKDLERWCLWINNEELEQAMDIPPIRERIEQVKRVRLSKTDKGAKKLAERPHQFRETNITSAVSIIVPSVSSEARKYIPIGFVDDKVVITNLAFAIYDCEPWLFGVITSRMHNIWIRTVCGCLETRIRYSSELGYNTFPLPDISSKQKESIELCVMDILEERENSSEMSLGQQYDSSLIPEKLLHAHRVLDTTVESCYREEPFLSDQQRLEYLFKMYSGLL